MSSVEPKPKWEPSAPMRKPGDLLRLHVVEARTATKKSAIYAGIKDKTFPAPVRLRGRTVAWRSEDIDAWIAARPTKAAADGNTV